MKKHGMILGLMVISALFVGISICPASSTFQGHPGGLTLIYCTNGNPNLADLTQTTAIAPIAFLGLPAQPGLRLGQSYPAFPFFSNRPEMSIDEVGPVNVRPYKVSWLDVKPWWSY